MPTPLVICPELTDRDFDQIAALVKQYCGINFHAGKRELVKSRLNKRLRTLGMASYGEYVDKLREDKSGRELNIMLDALSTNVTNFFREAAPFDYLGREFLPAIAETKKRQKCRLRLWSAGCSSGEEPYTMAVVLNEHLPNLNLWDAKILATDLSRQVIAVAREGVYPAERIKNLRAEIITRYFDVAGPEKYRVKKKLQSLVTFAQLNLMDDWPMRGFFDVIFCCNVMIYFDKETQQRLVNRFFGRLEPGGVLIIGHSESLAGVEHPFKLVRPTIYRRN